MQIPFMYLLDISEYYGQQEISDNCNMCTDNMRIIVQIVGYVDFVADFFNKGIGFVGILEICSFSSSLLTAVFCLFLFWENLCR